MRRRAFVGREAELAGLRAALGLARSGQPTVVVVEGPAGIGKTSLVERFLATTRRARALRASGEEAERHVDFAVADQLLRRAGRPGALDAPDHVTVGLAVLDLLTSEAPILVVDDAHWADTSSLRSVLFACRRLVAEPVLTILVTRGELPQGLRRLASETIAVGPLDAGDLQELGELTPAAARRLHDYTGGNPLFAGALLEHDTVPASYAEVIAGRLRDVSDAARDVVERAAVFGVKAPLAWLGSVEAVGEAVDARLLRWADRRTVAFEHPLARDAVYEQLGPARRLALHATAAGIVEDEASALEHRVRAATGADDALADAAEAFARREGNRGAWGRAVLAWEAARDLSGTREERERRALEAVNATLLAGDGGAARQALASAAFAPSPLLDAVQAYLAIYDADAERAEVLLERAWTRAPTPEIASRRALLAHNRLSADDMVRWAREAITRSGDDWRTASIATVQLAAGLALRGEREAAHATVDAALARLDVTVGQSGFSLRLLKGAWLLGEDDFERARGPLATASEEALRLGSLVIATESFALRAKLSFAVGDWDEAAALAARGVMLAEESGERWAAAFAGWAALHVAVARGETVSVVQGGGFERITEVCALARAEAADSPEAVVAALESAPSGFWPSAPALADALVDLGRLEEASAVVESGRVWGRSAPARLRRVAGRVAAARERFGDAGGAFEDARRVFAELGMPYDVALTQLEYGRALRRARRRHDAVVRLSEARAVFDRLGARPALELCERELAACGVASSSAERSILTPQEASVARLVASGLSNERVASELVVSVRTIETHLTRIYRKLGVGSRAELAARWR